MELIPQALVPVVRAYVQQQGYDPGMINGDGSLNASGAVSIFFDQVTVRTALTPDLIFPISASGERPSRAMEELMNQLRPSVTLSGRAGDVTVAPYGQAQGQRSWWPLIIGGTAAVGLLVWALSGK